MSHQITRVSKTSVRYVVDKLYAGYPFEIFAEIIRVHIHRFCDLGQRQVLAQALGDILSRFPNRDWLSAILETGAFEFSIRRRWAVRLLFSCRSLT